MIGQASEKKQREIIRLMEEQNRHLRALRAPKGLPRDKDGRLIITGADRKRVREEGKRTKKEKSSAGGGKWLGTVNKQGKEVGLLKGAFDQCRWWVGLKQDTWED